MTIETATETTEFDAVIMACHSDQALEALVQPSQAEVEVLGAIKYVDNQVILHGDASYMPRDPQNWSSWNARIDEETGRSETTYWMNRVQGIRGPQFFITLNPLCAPKRIWTERKYRHPVLGADAYEAQQRRMEINGSGRTFYCGAYWGMGGHEDGFRSGIDAAERLLISCLSSPVDQGRLTNPTIRRTWVMLTKGKAADRLQSSVIAVPSRYKIANALMLKGTWLCCVLGGVVFGLPALLVMFSVSLWQRELLRIFLTLWHLA